MRDPRLHRHGLRRRGRTGSADGRVDQDDGRRRTVDHADRVHPAGGSGRCRLRPAAQEAGLKPAFNAELKAERVLPPAPRTHWSNVLLLIGLIALVAASFATLPLKWHDFFSTDAIRTTREFLHGFMPPELRPAFLTKIAIATFET